MSVRIRPEQQEILARIPEASFFDEVVARLRADPPGPHGPEPAALEAWVRDRMARAHAHGITHQEHVWQFVKLSRQLGVGFDDEPWARGILALAVGGGTKINALWHELKGRSQPAGSGAD